MEGKLQKLERKLCIRGDDDSPRPTEVTNFCKVIYHTDQERLKLHMDGRWLIVRPFPELDSTWEELEARSGTLKDCVMFLKCSVMYYDPRKAGPGPTTAGWILVATAKQYKDQAGLALINIVKHDIKYKKRTPTSTPKYAWMGDDPCCDTLYWNKGQPSYEMTSQCDGPIYNIEDRWQLNVVQSPGDDGIVCGHWKIGMKRSSNLIATALWHKLKKVIEQDKLGPVDMVAPQRDLRHQKPQDNNSVLNEFILSTACHNRVLVGERIATIISAYKEPNILIKYEKNEVCNAECQHAPEWDGRYKHSIVWDQRSECFAYQFDLVAANRS